MAGGIRTDELAAGVVAGERRALARAITLVESTLPEHRTQALSLLEVLAPKAGRAMRVAISGTPGVGKSTFIERFGTHVIDDGNRIAVLAIDPSSTLSGGSILGDKTRMELLTRNEAAFIRPTPSGGTLGGVAARTREAILLCEAAGFDVVVVETVGVGQSETMAAQMTDMFVLLLAPAGGDELQGIKRGIIELADLILVNKADGDLVPIAAKAVGEYRLALQLIRPRSEHWSVPVSTCSALNDVGISDCWQTICEYRTVMHTHGEIAHRRASQAQAWLKSEINDALERRFRADPRVRARLKDIEAAVAKGTLPPTTAAQRLIDEFLNE
ncbi:MAG: methylmalonyl Co-A mutase-associated GTPase MeaB [Proteobacteria bacterium]|nr:methylmalonyl Co-A mutase-associated GTPase MeaB [Pseudomonadota bacterium]